MHLSLLPLKLQLDQRSVAFLQEFFHSADSAVAAGLRLEEFEDEVVVSIRELQFIFCLQNCFLPLSRNSGAARPGKIHISPPPGLHAAPSEVQGTGIFVQRCEVEPFTISIDYRPEGIDLAALRRWSMRQPDCLAASP